MNSISSLIKFQQMDPERVKKVKVKIDLSRVNLRKASFPLEKIRNMSTGLDREQLIMLGIHTDNITHKIKDQEPHRSYETTWTQHLGFRDCVDWVYRYCPECNEVYHKKAVLCDFDRNVTVTHVYKNTDEVISKFDGGLF